MLGLCAAVRGWAQERGLDWRLEVVRGAGITAGFADENEAACCDGVFAFHGSAEPAAWAKPGLAVVNFSAGVASPAYPSVWPDNAGAGAAAAEHLLSRGLRHFAYVGGSSRHWSASRGTGFAARLARESIQPMVYDADPDAPPPCTPTDPDPLAAWLAGLPRPCGVLCRDDSQAGRVLRACHVAGLKVGHDVAVMGVNDDPPCEFCDPPLTSVALPWAAVGRRGAQLMHDLLCGHTAPTGPVIVDAPPRVAARASTDLHAADDPLVREALRLIHRRAPRERLGVGQVAQALGVSRQTLHRLFIQSLGRSAKDEIQRVQLQHLRHQLIHTTDTIKHLSFAMGFPSQDEVCRFFRTHTGESPSAYRRRVRVTDAPPPAAPELA